MYVAWGQEEKDVYSKGRWWEVGDAYQATQLLCRVDLHYIMVLMMGVPPSPVGLAGDGVAAPATTHCRQRGLGLHVHAAVPRGHSDQPDRGEGKKQI